MDISHEAVEALIGKLDATHIPEAITTLRALAKRVTELEGERDKYRDALEEADRYYDQEYYPDPKQFNQHAAVLGNIVKQGLGHFGDKM